MLKKSLTTIMFLLLFTFFFTEAYQTWALKENNTELDPYRFQLSSP